jgi:fructose-bisphosphate aldolase class 1
MSEQDLIDTARTLVAGDKGLLAMDESNPTCNKRFAPVRRCHRAARLGEYNAAMERT